MAKKWVYFFGGKETEGNASMRDLLGGKGANLAEMSRLGLPVPPGFSISTEVCTHYYANEQSYPDDIKEQVWEALKKVERLSGKRFGDMHSPLMLSVRSGARVSMPGMMDTVLNLGLNSKSVLALIEKSGNERFAYDSYRRFIQMYSDVVLGIDVGEFEDILEDYKEDKGYSQDTQMSGADWKEIVNAYKVLVEEELDESFPESPEAQLWGAIGAVFKSWMVPRAQTYRKLHNISEDWGTAVNVQAMVFGNMGEDCATGVAFTRNPSTGEKALYGEFLINAQGEDVVAGIRTPQDITEASRIAAGSQNPSLEILMPDVFSQFTHICEKLERHYKDMQDLEFTVEQGKLWMLQTRKGKRTMSAALKIAVEMVEEELISEREAVDRIDPSSLDQLLHPTIAESAGHEELTTGLPASPGAAYGAVVFTADEAEAEKANGNPVILVRVETSPEDIHGMHAALGVLTTRGGMTSHAAVVARGMGKPCISGAGGIRVDLPRQQMIIEGKIINKGDFITLDGSSGRVFDGRVEMQQPETSQEFRRLMEWADDIRRMKVRTNAETPSDVKTALSFGAEGIGLCRTEHMFFQGERILSVREMILADTKVERQKALAKLLPMQRQDLIQIFELMEELPVTIRLLDPPLHEFLPKTEKEIEEVALNMGVNSEDLKERAQELHEVNPMLGNRGCRLLVLFPEIVEMQARAIFEATAELSKRTGATVKPEIMVPLVGMKSELENVRSTILSVAKEVEQENDVSLNFSIGTMIELPRAALRAEDIAEVAEFFSFGTNDLTQTTFGISRDDAASFLGNYQETGILKLDPFVSIDEKGVGELVSIGVRRGKSRRPDLKVGICGEHGGDPHSISFCEMIGLDYISCSPFRVPIARLAAAQAVLRSSSSR
ncbi:pyruvate, phosphate dikinase [Flexibacterium corallicola]|uniref:pyruvate, phosphate dikinase n=1 Tax=Flexibacterium corallicola TaxID=3037259 RepID=UPI00286F314D|nr:pyruvate, phosphate dikinase [Pseudovibrio sp. M1P-2-3]